MSLEQQDFCLSSSLKQQRERARIIAADIVEHECSPGFVSTEHMSIGEADNLSHALTEHVLAGKASNLRFASTEQELTGKRHNLSIASTEQELTEEVTLAGVPISMDILFEKDVWIADTGASNHGTYRDLGGKNVQTSTSSNLGIHGGAVKVEKTIDISGQFVE